MFKNLLTRVNSASCFLLNFETLAFCVEKKRNRNGRGFYIIFEQLFVFIIFDENFKDQN